jgi:hypothetical protein
VQVRGVPILNVYVELQNCHPREGGVFSLPSYCIQRNTRRKNRALAVVHCSVEELADKRKSCDIGYALAANSCEGVNSVAHAPSQPLM